MKQQTTLLFRLYAVVVLMDLMLLIFQNSGWRWFSKPLLMPLLLFGFYSGSNRRSGTAFYLIVAALVFSWAGDVLLQMKNMFIPGLVSFLLAHICYIVYFLRSNPGTKGLLQLQPLIGIPVLIYIIIFLWQLDPFLNALKIPVTIYAITIGVMLLASANMRRKTNNQAATLFLTGAFLFVLSDSLLAVNMFAYAHLILSVFVMATYASAQYLIVKGVMANEVRHSNTTPVF
jgi:uncharacterized membrane protein YhhN